MGFLELLRWLRLLVEDIIEGQWSPYIMIGSGKFVAILLLGA